MRIFHAALNHMQRLPGLTFTTSEEIQETGGLDVDVVLSKAGLGISPVGAPAQYAAESPLERPELSAPVLALLDLVADASLRSALGAALRAGAPLPDVGFELLGASGLVEAEAE